MPKTKATPGPACQPDREPAGFTLALVLGLLLSRPITQCGIVGCPWSSRAHAVRSGIMGAPVPGEYRRDGHNLASRGRADLLAIADVDADVRNPRHIRIGKEDKVPRLGVGDWHRGVELIHSHTRQADARRTIDVLYEATTVHACP